MNASQLVDASLARAEAALESRTVADLELAQASIRATEQRARGVVVMPRRQAPALPPPVKLECQHRFDGDECLVCGEVRESAGSS